MKSGISNPESFLVAVVGPTASGKSALALDLAERLGGELVNCDSVQIYRGFDIGTAKAAPRTVPAYIFDILEPTELFTAGEYARRARAVLEGIRARGRVPVLVGGTGFYLRALLEGLFPGPERSEDLRRRFAKRPVERLHRLLGRLDPVSAARIHPRDKPKLVRALEVCLQARRPMSQLWAEGRQGLEGFRAVKLGLNPPRAELYQRINARAAGMFHGGLLEEVRGLLDRGVPESAKPFESHGYAEALRVLRGEISLEEAIEITQRKVRRYAKRQMTWFRRERDLTWFHGFGDDPAVLRQALANCQGLGARSREPAGG